MEKGRRVDRFNIDGFHTWQPKVKLVLMKKGIWGVANAKEKNPRTKEEEIALLVKDEKQRLLLP